MSNQKITFHSYLEISSDPYFYWLVAAYSFVAVLNIAFLLLGYSNMNSLELMYPQWWGIFTELTLFDTPQTLLGILLSLLLLALVNARLTTNERKNRTLFFLIFTFVSTFVANLAWYMTPIARSSSTHGASQIAYAADAVLIVFTVFNLFYSYGFANSKRSKVLLPRHVGIRKFWNLTNVGILSSMIIVPILVPPTLVQAAPGINTFDHAVAFTVAFCGTVVYEFVTLFRGKH